MIAKQIRLVGKQVFDEAFEIEEGHAEIILNVEEVLGEIDKEDIEKYARFYFDLIHEDEFESSLDDFSEGELVDKLEEDGYNFSRLIGEEGCIEFLEDSGYTVTLNTSVDNSLDIIDSKMLDEITEIFMNASVFEREAIYNKIKNSL